MLRLAGSPSAAPQNKLRRSDFISHGVVMTSISPTPRPWPSNAAVSERNGNFRRMLLAVESFLLQDDRRHAIFEQRQAGVMGPGYDAENVHDDACGID